HARVRGAHLRRGPRPRVGRCGRVGAGRRVIRLGRARAVHGGYGDGARRRRAAACRRHPMHDLTLYRRVLRQTRPYWWHIAGLLGLGVLASPIAIWNPVPLKIVVDSVLGARPLPPVLQALLPSAPGPSPAAGVATAIGLLVGGPASGQTPGRAATLAPSAHGARRAR